MRSWCATHAHAHAHAHAAACETPARCLEAMNGLQPGDWRSEHSLPHVHNRRCRGCLHAKPVPVNRAPVEM